MRGPVQVIEHEEFSITPPRDVNNFYQKIRPPLEPIPPSVKNFSYRPLLDVVTDWSPDDADVPANFRETLQHFNYGDPVERAIAEKYRNEELPFKVYNISEFDNAANLWKDPYLVQQLDSRRHAQKHIESSKDNHFMFWSNKGKIKNYVPPTKMIYDMSFQEWLDLAYKADKEKLGNGSMHYYFMTGASKGDTGHGSFVAKDLPMFSSGKKNFFITVPKQNKGIQCRFGMRGVIAESHYDSGRNMIAMLKGQKRYILNPPEACKKLGIISERKHPSYRHSVIDWSDPLQAQAHKFDEVDAIDTILRKGEVLYVPSYWFHYMVSLEYSIQCNSRSGGPPGQQGLQYIKECVEY
jgi:oxalate decarboxylase/phosphoglucose isomerase-like protein (cupin superfamily)